MSREDHKTITRMTLIYGNGGCAGRVPASKYATPTTWPVLVTDRRLKTADWERNQESLLGTDAAEQQSKELVPVTGHGAVFVSER